MKISVLLPYKENFTPTYAGAVSLFIKETLSKSKYKKETVVYGYTEYEKRFNLKYKNININNKIFRSKSKEYINEFIKHQNKSNTKLIEIHNRPLYVKYLSTMMNIY